MDPSVEAWAGLIGGIVALLLLDLLVLHRGTDEISNRNAAWPTAGSELLKRFEWVVYVFGVLLLWSGVRMLRGDKEPDPENNLVLRLLRRRVPTIEHVDHAHLFVREDAVAESERPHRPPLWRRWYATPMLAVLVVIETSDVVFAVDSIPAIFGVTREPFIVFAATAFALVGLRSMYFLLADARHRFVYLDVGLAVILIFVGAKFLLEKVVEIGVAVSLGVIVVVMGVSVGASLMRSRRPVA